jgi:hypothetical protein
MPYWLGLFVSRRSYRHDRLYETIFHTVIILSKYHHHHHQGTYWTAGGIDSYWHSWLERPER